MKLYHFCSKEHIDSIKSAGLLFGKIPVVSKKGDLKGFIQPAQWLTSNESFKQEWCEHSTLPYNRNDYRITLNISLDHECLKNWIDLCHRLKDLKHSAKILNSFGDPENWYVMLGVIEPYFFKEITINPKII